MLVREVEVAEIEEVSHMIHEGFRTHIGPSTPPAGHESFGTFIAPEQMRDRIATRDSHCFVAEVDGAIVGALELSAARHILTLFVRGGFEGRGIGTSLINACIAHVREVNPGTDRITLNAVPIAMEFYRRLGFEPAGPGEVRNGIESVPMRLPLR